MTLLVFLLEYSTAKHRLWLFRRLFKQIEKFLSFDSIIRYSICSLNTIWFKYKSLFFNILILINKVFFFFKTLMNVSPHLHLAREARASTHREIIHAVAHLGMGTSRENVQVQLTCDRGNWNWGFRSVVTHIGLHSHTRLQA